MSFLTKSLQFSAKGDIKEASKKIIVSPKSLNYEKIILSYLRGGISYGVAFM